MKNLKILKYSVYAVSALSLTGCGEPKFSYMSKGQARGSAYAQAMNRC